MHEERPCWLFAFNPNFYPWQEIDYADAVAITRAGGIFGETWTCCSTKPRIGDRFYMMLLGMGELNGLIGSGRISATPYPVPAWDDPSRLKRCADIEFDSLLDYRYELPLPIAILRSAFPTQCWSPRASGISVKAEYVSDLYELWRTHIELNIVQS